MFSYILIFQSCLLILDCMGKQCMVASVGPPFILNLIPKSKQNCFFAIAIKSSGLAVGTQRGV